MLHISRSTIADYADATADHNPIHCDAAFAATGPFGRPVAHGTLALNAVWLGAEAAGYRIDGLAMQAKFTAPTFEGDLLSVEFDGEDHETTVFSVFTQDRRLVVAGTLSRSSGA